MSDKFVQTGSGRIFKEPATTEKSIRVELVSNLYQKSEDPKNNTHPIYTSIFLTGGLMKFWGGRISELVKGAKVIFHGEWNFSLFTKKDGTAGFSASIFSPSIFEVFPPKATNSQTSVETVSATKEDDLPF